MIHGENIVCFSSDWHQDPLSKHHIMTRLSKHNRVLWINSIGLRTPTVSVQDASRVFTKLMSFFKGVEKVNDNLMVISPIALPFHGNFIIDLFNKLFLRLQIVNYVKRFHFERPIVFTFLPNTAEFIGFLREKLLVYYITDDFTQFKGHPAATIEKMEKDLIARSDLVIATSQKLVEKKQIHGKAIHLVRHGVDHEHFARALSMALDELPDDIKKIPKPIVGFYGEINDWLDLPMLAEAAKKRPAWSFVMIGREAVEVGNIDYLKKIPNVYFLGQKKFAELPAYCAAFDAGLILRKINELTLSMNPLKLREYLAAGVPVISPPLPEVEPYSDVVTFATTADELIHSFEVIICQDTKKNGPVLSNRVKSDGWDGKVETISMLIEKSLQEKYG